MNYSDAIAEYRLASIDIALFIGSWCQNLEANIYSKRSHPLDQLLLSRTGGKTQVFKETGIPVR